MDQSMGKRVKNAIAGITGKATISKIAAAVAAVCVVGGGVAVGVSAVMGSNSDDAAETGIAEIEEIEKEETGISGMLLTGVHFDEDLKEVHLYDETSMGNIYAEEKGDELLDYMTAESNESVDNDKIADDGIFGGELSSEEIYAEVIDMYTAYHDDEISLDELIEWAHEHEYPYDFSATFDKSYNPEENPYYRHDYYFTLFKDLDWGYAFYDINDDGTEEFILSRESYYIPDAYDCAMAIWTWDGEKLVIVSDGYFSRIFKNTVGRGISDAYYAYYEIRSDGKLMPALVVDYGCEAEPISKGYVSVDPEMMEELADVWPLMQWTFIDDYWNKVTDEELSLIREWAQPIDSELDWHPLY